MKTLETGTEQGGLYYLSTSSSNQPSQPSQSSLHISTTTVPDFLNVSSSAVTSDIVSAFNVVSDAKLWHLRLGHALSNVLQYVSCIGKLSVDKDDVCPVCPCAKQ